MHKFLLYIYVKVQIPMGQSVSYVEVPLKSHSSTRSHIRFKKHLSSFYRESYSSFALYKSTLSSTLNETIPVGNISKILDLEVDKPSLADTSTILLWHMSKYHQGRNYACLGFSLVFILAPYFFGSVDDDAEGEKYKIPTFFWQVLLIYGCLVVHKLFQENSQKPLKCSKFGKRSKEHSLV